MLMVDVPWMSHSWSGNVSVIVLCSLTMGAAADALPDAAMVSASAPARASASFHTVAARRMANRVAVRVPCVRLVRRNRSEPWSAEVAPRPYFLDAFMFPSPGWCLRRRAHLHRVAGLVCRCRDRANYRRTIPLVKNEPSAATQSMAIACDAGRGVVDAVAASSTI